MSSADHEIVWMFQGDSVEADFVCNNEDCEYRWTCPDCCEYIGPMEKTDSGYRHQARGELLEETGWHEMVPSPCNFREWMLSDPAMIPELSDDLTPFEIGRTPVEPVWSGDETHWIRTEEQKR